MVLVPVGIINERHEPPVFNGVERPFVDTVIVPTTWFDVGVGVHGEVGNGFRYRAYAMAPLDALEFTAEDGIRRGAAERLAGQRQEPGVHGPRRVPRHPRPHAWSQRLDAANRRSRAARLDTTVRVVEADARYQRGPFEGRAQFAQVGIDDAGPLNEAIQRLTGVSPNIARTLRGWYGEAAYRVWDRARPRDLVTFVRYENFDTQFRMPDGYLPLKQFDRDAWIVGITYYPDVDIAVKADYVWTRNQSSVVRGPNSVNIGLGWWF